MDVVCCGRALNALFSWYRKLCEFFSARQAEHNDTVKKEMTETVSQNLAYHKRTQIFSDKLMCIITFTCTHITAEITHSLTEVQCLLIHILSAILQQCKLFAINIQMPKLMLWNCEDHSQLFTNKWSWKPQLVETLILKKKTVKLLFGKSYCCSYK